MKWNEIPTRKRRQLLVGLGGLVGLSTLLFEPPADSVTEFTSADYALIPLASFLCGVFANGFFFFIPDVPRTKISWDAPYSDKQQPHEILYFTGEVGLAVSTFQIVGEYVAHGFTNGWFVLLISLGIIASSRLFQMVFRSKLIDYTESI